MSQCDMIRHTHRRHRNVAQREIAPTDRVASGNPDTVLHLALELFEQSMQRRRDLGEGRRGIAHLVE